MLKIIAVGMVVILTAIAADSSNPHPQNTSIPKSCVRVMTDMRNDKIHRRITPYGKDRKIVVQWGAGETNRASAALLYITLKYYHGYQDAVLEQGKETLCEVATNFKEDDEVLIHVGAKTTENDLNCSALVSCVDPRDVCTIAGPKLHIMGLAMAPFVPQLNVTLSEQARQNPRCTEITSTINKQLDTFHQTDLEKCGFLSQGPNLSFNESHLKNEYLNQYQYQCFYSMPSFRVAPANILQQFAPRVFSIVRRFAPTTEDITEILKLNMTTQNIEEAACQYFLQGENPLSDLREKHKFKTWAIPSDPNPWALVLLCEGDPHLYWYVNVSKKVAETLNKLTVNFSKINCRDVNMFNQVLFQWQDDMRWVNMIGVVGGGAGASLAAEAANATETQVVLYDVPPDSANLGNYTRTATGRVKPLALALQNFLQENRWRRIAIISDRTQLAEDFNKYLCANSTLIAPRKRFIDDDDVNANAAEKILKEFRDEKASVFFVNTDSQTAGDVLCAARNLQMSDHKSYVWIVREWGTQNHTLIPCDMASMRYFIVTYWWRGQHEADLPTEATMSKLREEMNNMSNDAWPPLTAPLVDAILLLWYQMNASLQAYPELRDNLHVDGNAKKIAESFSKKSDVSGIVQILKQKDSSLEKPLVFIYEWYRENNSDLLAIWKVDNESVKLVSPIRKTLYPNGAAPSDGSEYCVTITSGDPYDLACYDAAILTSVAILVLMLFLVYLGYRHWMKKLKQRDHIMQMRMLARSEHIVAALGPYIVSRSSLEIREQLGVGNFGQVHFGVLRLQRRTIPVAVKSLREDASLNEESQFLHEACMLSRQSHVNIVRLIGVCAADGRSPLVMMEHAFFCDLRRYLTSRRHYAEFKVEVINLHGASEASYISPYELTRLAREAAAALEYLCFKRVVHRDVRAANCLIDGSRTLKLADFGMARVIAASKKSEDVTTTAQPNDMTQESYSLRTISEPMNYSYICRRRRDMFPVAWMAPESLAIGEFSSASDIWSFGVMVLEIVMLGQRPFGSWSPQQIYQYLIHKGTPQLPLEISYNTREVIEMCWWTEPRRRSTAATIRAHLQANPTALRHCVAAKNENLANTKNKSWNTSDSGYSERRDIFTEDPRISTW